MQFTAVAGSRHVFPRRRTISATMLSSFRRLMPGCARLLQVDGNEVFREFFARESSRLFRKVSTKQERRLATVAGKESLVLHKTNGQSDRRPATSGGKGKLKGALGLKEFMHRTRVLDLYRGILKRARTLEDKDVAADARRQFKLSSDEVDPLKIQMLVADAANYLEAMQGSVRGGGGGGGGKGNGEGDGSWINTKDPDDKRGRVGEGFPWQK